MFSEAQKTAYQSMTPPAELREKVLQMAKNAPAKPVERKRPVRNWMTTAVAACLVLVASVSMLHRGSDVTLQLDGMEVTETAATISVNTPMAARAIASMCLPVTVETETDAEVIASHGQILAENGAEVTAVSAGTTTLYWAIGAVETSEEYSLRICGETTTLMILAFDATENCWTVSATKE